MTKSMNTIPKKAQGLRTWVEIDTRALGKNVHALKRVPKKGVLLMGIVKSNAYGHGLVPVAQALEAYGVAWLGVDSLVEAARLRKEGVRTPLLVLGYTLPEHFATASKEKISLTISSFPALREVSTWTAKTKKRLNVHIKIDSGMHRQGFLSEDMPELSRALSETTKFLRIEGIYSHLAEANPEALVLGEKQIELFRDCIKALSLATDRERGKPLLHISASGGILCFPNEFSMVRAGAALYGLWPSPEAHKAKSKEIALTPVLSWRTLVVEIKHIRRGEKVGYSFTEAVRRDSTIAVCPIGYWHGYPRALSGKSDVLVRGKRAKVLGRVSMDMIVIDVTGIRGVSAMDVVTLIGKDGTEELSADEVACFAGTTHYEIVTRINPLIERIIK
ncbi:MAG: alanine racemase [Candidatus Lloydbacteria bacterium RIFCSPHIGHO2_02_FULL_51_22]|uniref:Alanine racemase n=3 Tax=Candidatus Lloydiibacteriota TaxID=1817910 RepID=A0A1G2D8A3_9BACT|nr:MAG: alanine racemase [Candidatus Lloydbacteria bacterium RIFCSPHIGHO2_02_FULL_51_22]OGZ15201.1 MAG: alanine racemase [Candidatus Lloydbacteria bacterium RIFCSPLOWO2_02_FULL_51_11]OGZ16286.1 MAG: alanine racemase [Candidatus Lloydbacteria bacterium RIFCSPLOWO2_12_FULL_51_9]